MARTLGLNICGWKKLNQMLIDLPYNVGLPARWSIFSVSCSSRTREPDSFEISN
jgi:hypothetical protein